MQTRDIIDFIKLLTIKTQVCITKNVKDVYKMLTLKQYAIRAVRAFE